MMAAEMLRSNYVQRRTTTMIWFIYLMIDSTIPVESDIGESAYSIILIVYISNN